MRVLAIHGTPPLLFGYVIMGSVMFWGTAFVLLRWWWL
jgi:hypothetical protein